MSTDEQDGTEPGNEETTGAGADGAESASQESGGVRRTSPTRRARRIGGLSRPVPGTPARADSAAEPVAAPDPATARELEAAAAGRVPADTEVPDEEPAPARGEVPTWLRWLPAGALTLAAVIMLVFFLIVSHGVWWGRPSAQTVRDQVLAAAKSCTVATNSWNYQSLAADEAKGVACTTGSRTSDYQKAMQKVIKPLAVKLQASQVAQVNYAGLSDVSPDGHSWNILIVGQLTVRQKSNPQGRQDPFAALVRMDQVHGQWLMARIQEVAGPAAK